MPRHIVIKLTKIKDKEKVLKATREKQQQQILRDKVRTQTQVSKAYNHYTILYDKQAIEEELDQTLSV